MGLIALYIVGILWDLLAAFGAIHVTDKTINRLSRKAQTTQGLSIFSMMNTGRGAPSFIIFRNIHAPTLRNRQP